MFCMKKDSLQGSRQADCQINQSVTESESTLLSLLNHILICRDEYLYATVL